MEPSRPRGLRALVAATTSPLFIVSASRRLRFANNAWEEVVGRTYEKARGMRISSRRSAGSLAQALVPPPEVWQGTITKVRRALPDALHGPPWWDITFVPLKSRTNIAAVLGFLEQIGTAPPRQEPTLSVSHAALRQQSASRYSFDRLDGIAPTTIRLGAQARAAASSMAPVWIVGAKGSGKKTLARVLHHQGQSRELGFWHVDCAGVPWRLIAMQLLGKGGFRDPGTIGTIYLDRPHALPRDLQEQFLTRFPATNPRTRIISGSTESPLVEVRSGKLLPEFHTQFSIVELHLPSLKDRFLDLPKLIDTMFGDLALGEWKSDEAVLSLLQTHDWPENLSELKRTLLAAYRQSGGHPKIDHFPRSIRERALTLRETSREVSWKLDPLLEAVEKQIIIAALQKEKGARTAAAERLGIFRNRLLRRIEALGIAVEENS